MINENNKNILQKNYHTFVLLKNYLLSDTQQYSFPSNLI